MALSPFIGEIRMFAGSFAPVGWALCNGQILSIAENETLFGLIGTTYGGDGVTNFALPDLRGRLPVHQGQATGLANYVIGEASGSESVTLITSQLPTHSHAARCSSQAGTSKNPTGQVWAPDGSGQTFSYDKASNNAMAAGAIGGAGGNQPHDNLQPYLVVNFIIALAGIFPTQN